MPSRNPSFILRSSAFGFSPEKIGGVDEPDCLAASPGPGAAGAVPAAGALECSSGPAGPTMEFSAFPREVNSDEEMGPGEDMACKRSNDENVVTSSASFDPEVRAHPNA
ncbi:hypothetical protein CY652_03890 [Burkholderia sp. WAC0059]|nr:hypothetical protein CY652_03890 [Burkholderia sp. WAC0059]